MKQFIVYASHDIYEDSYTEGELGHVQSYDSQYQIVKAATAEEAVGMFVKSHIGNVELEDISFEFDNAFTSVLESKDGYQASASEIEMWKAGKCTLYSNNVSMRVYEMTKISFTK